MSTNQRPKTIIATIHYEGVFTGLFPDIKAAEAWTKEIEKHISRSFKITRVEVLPIDHFEERAE